MPTSPDSPDSPNPDTPTTPSTTPPSTTRDPYSRVFQSSNITSGNYTPSTAVLALTFANGTTYVYTSVPLKVWEELRDAVSPGSYFAANIRSNPSHPSYKRTAIG